uniref:Uncharacterized protein n=1 Tax=Arundo donax TaxID=35708 RepID=A0A0A9FRR1_ARUDO
MESGSPSMFSFPFPCLSSSVVHCIATICGLLFLGLSKKE